ncbi:Uncharacterized conserved protein [Mycobacteroides abscessus subsp. massiliense]|nr:hypothetical protein MM1S1520914_1002 [Mycobacteroides abscessus subsp. bolletii 1S-152-0914]MBE5479461.1 hypothetical protein [Mycobacteroides abscessus]SKI32210.1 Uncharacterized conserved protein [Mycobacteroides abscessus subsp. massiliense]QOF31896.1 hypothetical protein E3G57_000782 [Mycobacteroides abscessus]SKO21777.1 Uncharacterized conserved protein [Mycobacteroides abscessus subsp. massiliense]
MILTVLSIEAWPNGAMTLAHRGRLSPRPTPPQITPLLQYHGSQLRRVPAGSSLQAGSDDAPLRPMGTAETTTTAVVAMGTLVSIGYEGKTVDHLVAQLLEQDVRILVDVRLTPLSRKPGLSKTKLAEALRAAGIDYVHHRALGNPKDNRAGFRAGEPESLTRYREVLDTAAATDALAHVCELLDDGVVALLCFEQDHAECHRNIVVDRLLRTRPNAAVVHV